MKYIKLPPNFHFITFCDCSICWGVMREASLGKCFLFKVNFIKSLYPQTPIQEAELLSFD